MRIRSAILALSLVPAAAFSMAAAPEGCSVYSDAGTADESDDVLTCEEVQYLSCEDAIGGKYHDFFNATTVKLTPEAPTGSFTAGEGCGYAEEPFFLGTRQDTAFSFDTGGFFFTNIDTLTVELHDLGPLQNAINVADDEILLDVRISIDGASPFGGEENTSVDGTVSQSPLTLTIPVEAVMSSTGASTAMVFTVENILADLPQNMTGGTDNVFSEVKVTIEFPTTNVAPVWGATEVPASITVNGDSRGTIVDALEHN